MRVCLPGAVDSCVCSDGMPGIATCLPTGLATGPCQCGTGAMVLPPDSQGAGTSGTAGAAGTMPVGGMGAGAAATGGMGAVVQPPADAGTATPPETDMRARDIKIAEIALYQAVKVPLAADGEAVIARNAPAIIGKAGLLRVFVEPLSGFSPREIEAELTLSSAEAPVESQTVRQRINSASSDGMLDSTINFDLAATDVTADLRWAVTLREVAAPSGGMADPGARFPEQDDELIELGARAAGPLRVMLVPYRYNGDGSGRLPVLDDEQLELFRDYIYAFYPITEVQFEMHEPVDYNSQVGPNTGWENWLDSHCQLRTRESPDPKLLYYGLMAPRADLRAYGGGVIGISYLPGPAANFGRCSVGVGFDGAIAASTMAHELGHSLGLPHAPCGVSGGPFPYAEAKIGTWGYSLASGTLKDPDRTYDLMSYCDPVFISDYNFQKLFERIRYLNLQFDTIPLPNGPRTYLRVLQTADGSRRVTGKMTSNELPGGPEEERTLTLLDASGASMGETTGYFFESSEEGSGLWLVPDTGAAAVELDATGMVVLP